MKHLRLLIAAATLGALAAFVVAVGAQVTAPDKAEVALRAAMEKESVRGDVKAAIDEYRTIATTYAKSNRAVAARALLRIGQCYEKLGNDEARKAYQRLVLEFADQPEQARVARERLAALAKATEAVAPAPKFRRIEIPGKPTNRSAAMLSPDGTHFAFVAEGSIWTVPVSGSVHPDIAGEPVRLTKDMGAWDAGNCAVTWSVDGQWIGFRGRPADSVYLVPASGGEPRRVDGIGPAPGGAQSFRISVSQAGKKVVFGAGVEGERLPRLFTIPGGGGRPTQLVPGTALQPAFSPNGKLVAYIKLEPLPSGSGWLRRIMVVAADGGEPVLISAMPGDVISEGPIWSPDGKMIAFPVVTDNAPEKSRVWIVPVSSDGRPEAEPTILDVKSIVLATLHGKPARKFVNPLGGWSLRNEIAFLLESPLDSGIYTVPVSGGRATRIALEGREPRWSPDGKRVFFRGKTNIESVAARGGDESSVPIRSEIPMNVWFPTGSNEVSKDGRSIVFAGGYRGNEQRPGATGIFTVPSQGGDARPIAVPAGSVPLNPSWSPDGKWIAYTQTRSAPEGPGAGVSIWIASSEGGSPKQLTSDADRVEEAEVRWSPDGKTIAYFGADKTVRLIPSTGGPSRVLAQIPVVNYALGLSWSPDGSKLAYTTIQKAWVIPASGGEPREIPVGFEGRITQIDWSPDGQTLAFCGATGGEEEVWIMSDFVNLVKTARR